MTDTTPQNEQLKTCTKCKLDKPRAAFSKSKRDGLRSCCKTCDSEANKKYYAANLANIHRRAAISNEPKTCTKCDGEKARSEFGKHRGKYDGLQSACRECRARHHADNFEKINARTRKYYADHPEKMRARKRTTKRKASQRKAVQRHGARKAGLPSTLTVQEWQEILLPAFGWACAYCGTRRADPGHVLEQEHVIPIAQDGPYTLENIVPACQSCNRSKGGRTPAQAGMQLRPPLFDYLNGADAHGRKLL